MSSYKTRQILKTTTLLVAFPISFPAWADGYIPDKWIDFTPVREQPALLVGALGVLLVWCYYRAVKLLTDRRAASAVFSPHLVAPSELSPAMVRYLLVKEVDQYCVVAALLSMAEKGAVTIEEQHGTYALCRTRTSGAVLSLDENALATALFDGVDEIQLRTKTYDRLVGDIPHVKDDRWTRREALADLLNGATRRFARALKNACSPKYVSHHLGAWAFGMLLSVVVVAVSLYAEPFTEPMQATFGRIATLFVTAVLLAAPIGGREWLWLEWRKYLVEKRWLSLAFGAGLFTITPATTALAWAIVPHISSELVHRFASPCVSLLALILLGMGMWFRISLRTLTAQGRSVLEQMEYSTRLMAGSEKASLSWRQEQSNSKEAQDRIASFVVALKPETARRKARAQNHSCGTADGKFGALPGSIQRAGDLGTALARAMMYSSQPRGWGSETMVH